MPSQTASLNEGVGKRACCPANSLRQSLHAHGYSTIFMVASLPSFYFFFSLHLVYSLTLHEQTVRQVERHGSVW